MLDGGCGRVPGVDRGRPTPAILSRVLDDAVLKVGPHITMIAVIVEVQTVPATRLPGQRCERDRLLLCADRPELSLPVVGVSRDLKARAACEA